jgi:hypothetical protein
MTNKTNTEVVEEFDNLTDKTWLTSKDMGTVKHQQTAWLTQALQAKDTQAEEMMREVLRGNKSPLTASDYVNTGHIRQTAQKYGIDLNSYKK